eukprot:gnl/MRDRNA2_/MRDRNA2_39195_c0_seq1.p1 gnl/MRDRNA2_/MRDRNA2_39195_c0~~gnl/MRDRNA2_/MRDRNA2_39195_c0_seq1.p1  ORF type:complete len:545 (-),score=164.60 gnl/MRDRNA2_/MRDRNA2_39195_c0_seq1:173-1807(-)
MGTKRQKVREDDLGGSPDPKHKEIEHTDADAEVVESSKKKKKKKRIEDQMEEDVELPDERPKKSKKMKQSPIANEDANVDEALTERIVDSGKKKKKKRNEERIEVEVELADEQPKKRKKQKTEAISEENVVKPKTEITSQTKKRKASKDGLIEEHDAVNDEVASDKAEVSTTKVFVGGVPWSCTEEVLRKDFSECGEIVDFHMVKDFATGLFKGIALITYKDEAGVQAALAYNGDDYGGRRLEVRRDNKAGEKGTKGKGKGKNSTAGQDNSGGELEVFIRGLPPEAKEKELKKEFSKCGDVSRCKMDVDMANQFRCKGYAWITFKTQQGMTNALARDCSEYLGSTITVQRTVEHKSSNKKSQDSVEVFVRGFSSDTKQHAFSKHFAACGEIERINMPRGSDGSCKGYAWITFKGMEAAEKATAQNETQYQGSKLKIEIAGKHREGAKGKAAGKGSGQKPAGCTSIVVKGLAYDATEDDLRSMFASCGNGPQNISILSDWNTGKSKGIAFVDFDDEKAIDPAMELSGSKIKGRAFTLDYAAPRAQ